jgi:pimeloyl-ACP methyl ester carboxylesterase
VGELGPLTGGRRRRGHVPRSSYGLESEQWALVCRVFPHRTESPADWKNPRSNVPALVLVGGADPQDPIDNIAAIRATMPRARILVAPGQGHGVGQLP